MKRASYREAIEWVALNDDAGSRDAYCPDVVACYVTSALVADIFGVDSDRVGADIVKVRLRERKKLAEKIAG